MLPFWYKHHIQIYTPKCNGNIVHAANFGKLNSMKFLNMTFEPTGIQVVLVFKLCLIIKKVEKK